MKTRTHAFDKRACVPNKHAKNNCDSHNGHTKDPRLVERRFNRPIALPLIMNPKQSIVLLHSTIKRNHKHQKIRFSDVSPLIPQGPTEKLARYRMYKYTYSTQWIPWLIHPMKDVHGCDKPGEAAKKRYTPGFPNGGTQYGKSVLPIWWTLAELKYLT